MTELERKGIPTVTVTASGFESDARGTARGLGLKQLALAVVSSALTNLPPEQVRKEVTAILDTIVQGLTEESAVTGAEEKPAPKSYRFQAADRLEAAEEMGRFFLRNGWGDGFPLVPPTADRVDRMLAGTSRSPRDVVTVMEPGMGEGTAEKLAINAVMAGCLPEHMPVIIAAVEAMADPRFNLNGVACSTCPHAPILIVNGPIAKELNINSGRGALGPGAQSFANTVIGRAIRLIMMNVGHAYVGELDMDTIGSPNKYSMCVAENEEKNPWEPFHVERGFARETSTVTVFGVEAQIQMTDMRSLTPEHLLQSFAGTAICPGACSVSVWPRGYRIWQNVLLMCPDHAKIIAERGWSKQDAREFLYHNARIEWRYLKYGGTLHPGSIKPAWKWLLDAPEDMLLPIVGAPDWFHIVVVGGPVGKSAYLTGVGEPVTVEIKK
ncbi:MAG: hypothetical protein HYX92_16320 [Chloroflexi bacterium]|nr:hypothetical protein [Chloroflexota bacterium]